MNIREAKPEDSEQISLLINGVAHYFTLDQSGKGVEHFLESISPEAIKRYIKSPDYFYIVAFHENKMAGVAALKGESHIFHLFVAPSFQRQGLARQLWEAIKGRVGPGTEFTVNSTPYAVPVYEKLGFVVAGPREEKNGIAFVPMQTKIISQNG